MLSAAARIITMSAPAFAAISVSKAPVSIVFISATIVFFGKLSFNFLIMSIPSLFIRGVPASSQSAPPFTESFAIAIALCSFSKSSATCNITPFIKHGIRRACLKT